MKYYILAAALAAPFFSFAADGGGAPQPLSDEQIEQIKRDTARAGGELGAYTFQVSPTGEVVKDAAGNPVMQPMGNTGLGDGLKLFQATTGTVGVSEDNLPLDYQAGKATVSGEQSFDIQCLKKLSKGLQYSPLGVSLRPISCSFASESQVQAIDFKVCENAAKAGTCTTDADFSGTLSATVGSFVSYKGLSIGVGCNTTAKCRVTVKGQTQFGGNNESLRAESATVAGQSNTVGQLRDMVTSGGYSDKISELGQPLADCAVLNEQGGNTGQYTTCDGKSTVVLDSSTDKSSCGTTATCLQESISERVSKKTCIRTFPMTERSIQQEYGSYQTCLVTDYLADKKGVDKFGKDNNSCQTGGSNTISGMTKVGETPEWTCVQEGVLNDPPPTQPFYDKDKKLMVPPYPDPLPVVYDSNGNVIKKPYEDPVVECVAKQKTEYWVNLSNVKVVSQKDSPSPVGGDCDDNPLSESRLEQCEGGVWFGRTLPESSCGVTVQVSPEESVSGGINFQKLWGCGFCLKPRVRLTCRGVPNPGTEGGADTEDSCESLDLDGCSMTKAEALTLSGGGSGITTSQRETYSCITRERQCTKWSAGDSDSGCVKTDLSVGLDKIRDSSLRDTESFNNAMVAASLVDGVAHGSEGKQADHQVPLIFDGKVGRCSYPVGIVGSLVTKNCCRQDLYRPKKGILFQKGCGMEETELAAAKRSRYSHYVGEHCTMRLPWPLKTCIRREQAHCIFQGILPRIVHEQGREQLEAMVASSGSSQSQKAQLQFDFYDSGAGSWAPAQVVNGVTIKAWRWPKYCANLASAAEARAMDPTYSECPATVETWFAACDKQGGCSELNEPPEYGASSLDWTLRPVDSLKNQTTAISKYAVTTGACVPNSGSCKYEVSAWPAGVGGKAVVTKDLVWPLFSPQAQGAAGSATAQDYTFNNVGDLMFRMYPSPGVVGSGLPATVRLGFSRDGGQTWNDATLSTTALKASETTLPGSDIAITGSCDASANQCAYRITGTVTVEAKPWGNAENPNCTGFTAGQLAALDFSRMDLSEWLDTVMDKVGGNTDPTLAAASANKNFQNFNALYQSGQVGANPPVAANFARAVPSEGFGGYDKSGKPLFKTSLLVSAYWPEYSSNAANNTEKVTSVEVDWGDCSAPENLTAVSGNGGQGFSASHEYQVPDSDQHACLKTGPGDDLERNIIHKIKLSVITTKGSYTRHLSVENAWAKFPGANSNNDHVQEKKTAAPYGTDSGGAPATVLSGQK